MTATLETVVKESCQAHGHDRHRMMDIVRAVQRRQGCVDAEAQRLIAEEVGCSRAEVASVVSFYSFLSRRPQGQVAMSAIE